MKFQLFCLFAYLWQAVFVAADGNSPNFVQGDQGSVSVKATNGCPCLDFSFHAQNTGTIQYNVDVTDVKWVQDNIYTVTIHTYGSKQIPLKSLWSLKIIGVNSPDGGTFQLYGFNEKTFKIDNPTDWSATFRVYGQPDGSDPSIV